jgi:NADH:ubiquinone oxidoreductase subunit 6 (subunit J)
MFTRYSLPFEAASVLLLATTVGVMVLAKRQRSAPPEGEERS